MAIKKTLESLSFDQRRGQGDSGIDGTILVESTHVPSWVVKVSITTQINLFNSSLSCYTNGSTLPIFIIVERSLALFISCNRYFLHSLCQSLSTNSLFNIHLTASIC